MAEAQKKMIEDLEARIKQFDKRIHRKSKNR